MTATTTQARDEINAVFKDAWEADPASQNLPVRYDDDGVDTLPDTDTAWARVTVKHLQGGLGGFGGTAARFEREGAAIVQIFTPRGDGMQLNDQLVEIVLGAFRQKKTANGVTFHSVRSREAGPDFKGWQQTNVIAEFRYSQ